MNFLVTGAGLVGCHVAQLMHQRGHEVVLYDMAPRDDYVGRVAPGIPVVQGDVRDLATLVDTMQSRHIDTVLHSAFLIGRTIEEHPHMGMRSNVDGAMAIAEAIRLCKGRRLIFASSFGIYRWDLSPSSPITEDFAVGGDRFYAASKVACERILAAFAKWYQLEFAILRFAQVYGLGHYGGGDLAGPAMHAALASALKGDPVRIDPGVLSINDYVYVKDLAEGVASACERPIHHDVYNLGSGMLSSPQDVAESIRTAVTGARVEVLSHAVAGPYWRHEQKLDLARSRQELGYEPKFDLIRGLGDFAAELQKTHSGAAL